ncbi:MAG TPA: RDD family protein [Lysobacter sp.]|nr:RDD family protein [Lysobacter sp.]
MTSWYYSDSDRNRHGPVSAEDMARLHADRRLAPDTLVWRAGLPDWRPWRELAHEVAPAPAATVAAPAPAPAATPVMSAEPVRAEPERAPTPTASGPAPEPALADAEAAADADGIAVAAPARAAASGRARFVVADDEAPVGAARNPYEVVAASAATAAPVASSEPDSPYAPPQAALADGTGYVPHGEVVYAGVRKRLAAITIDGLLIGVATYAVQMIGMGVAFGLGAAGAMDATQVFAAGGLIGILLFMVLVPIAMNAVYYAAMHASGRQATLGKMAVGIKVTDEVGARISFLRGLGRYFATWLSGLILGIGYLMAAFTDRKRALHDMLASTLVVDQWAFTAHPERQRRELGTVTVVVLVLLGLLVVGYFALIALAIGLGAMAAAGGG